MAFAVPRNEIIIGIGNNRRNIIIHIKRRFAGRFINPINCLKLVANADMAISVGTRGKVGF